MTYKVLLYRGGSLVKPTINILWNIVVLFQETLFLGTFYFMCCRELAKFVTR